MTKLQHISIFILLFIVSLFFSFLSPSFAQEPPGQDIGAQAERFDEEQQQKKQQLEKEKAETPEIQVEEEKPQPPQEGPSFVLKSVKITGSTIFSEKDLAPLYKPYIDKQVTFQGLQVIIDKIKLKYKQEGYITSTAYIPEQEIKDGNIEIAAAEGKMGELIIDGNKWFTVGLLKKYFHTAKNKILNINKVQKDILSLNQNPDLAIRAMLSAGKEPGTSDVTLKVADSVPHHIGNSCDNQGTRLVGRWRDSVSVRSSNMLNRMDSVYISSLATKDSLGESLSYSLPIDTYGTKFGLDAVYFFMRVGKEYKYLDITGNTKMLTPHITKELYLSEKFQAYIDAGLEIKSIKKYMADNLTTNDEMRSPYIGFDFTANDFLGGQTVFAPRLTFGTEHFLGASNRNENTLSRDGSGKAFVKYEHSIRRIQLMPFDSYIAMRSRLQLASHTLASAEQFQLGGANSVRGFPEGDFLGDYGANLNIDWIFPMYLIPKQWKVRGQDAPLQKQIQPVLFADFGYAGIINPTVSETKKEKFLMGLGGGVRCRFSDNFYLRLEWADAIKMDDNKPISGAGASTFTFALQIEV
ncbi:MAG: ShlB/FhaC/HecB family hemolysin secretion/activation protein [Candidatus Omnitrophota bacterium]